MDIEGLAVGAIVGFIVGAILFTPTGKALTGAGGEAARRAYPTRRKRK